MHSRLQLQLLKITEATHAFKYWAHWRTMCWTYESHASSCKLVRSRNPHKLTTSHLTMSRSRFINKWIFLGFLRTHEQLEPYSAQGRSIARNEHWEYKLLKPPHKTPIAPIGLASQGLYWKITRHASYFCACICPRATKVSYGVNLTSDLDLKTSTQRKAGGLPVHQPFQVTTSRLSYSCRTLTCIVINDFVKSGLLRVVHWPTLVDVLLPVLTPPLMNACCSQLIQA